MNIYRIILSNTVKCFTKKFTVIADSEESAINMIKDEYRIDCNDSDFDIERINGGMIIAYSEYGVNIQYADTVEIY